MSFILRITIACFVLAAPVSAFCGFYVAKADGELFNEASKVVYVRDKKRTVITMSSDYSGPAKDFAMIVPTPKVLQREDVRTVKTATIDHLDAYSAPRLVEYHDHDPCGPQIMYEMMAEPAATSRKNKVQKRRGAAALGVTIKAEYAVGIYDILILKAKQSDGLVTWLKSEEYNLPDGAEDALAGYINMGMKFFVAKVNLSRHKSAKTTELEPLQISFRSKDFMLPIQLGKVNSKGTQDVLAMFLTRTGQVETANYRTQKIPTDVVIPTFVKSMFGNFYKSMFKKSVGNQGVVMEYAWDMAWCDPCAADPLTGSELRELGVHWVGSDKPNAGEDVFVTRLHMRYDENTMTRDPMFKHTNRRQNFQGRYIMNQPFVGDVSCKAGQEYVKQKRKTLREEAVTLADITNWSPRKIETRIRKSVPKSYW
jgi:hypothetical protein